jgi:hypothetical protein
MNTSFMQLQRMVEASIHRTVDAVGPGWSAAGRPRGAAKMAAQPIRRRGAPGEAG